MALESPVRMRHDKKYKDENVPPDLLIAWNRFSLRKYKQYPCTNQLLSLIATFERKKHESSLQQT